MSLDEIAALPVRTLAEDQSHLYLWTINSYVEDSYEIARVWGFRPSTLLVWAKTPMGRAPGGTWASNVEYVLFARRGILATSRSYDTRWFNWPRTTVHSKKPEAFLDMVEATSPGPYLELFARRQRLGWDSWGNEALEHVDMGQQESGISMSRETPAKRDICRDRLLEWLLVAYHPFAGVLRPVSGRAAG